MKKYIYILLSIIIAAWVGYRVYAIYSESQREVFNAARVSEKTVETMVAHEEMGVLKEPLFIKDNRAFVSHSRIRKFGVGQRIGAGHIISVSSKLDLDTGMYLIKTANVEDGEQFAEAKYTGFFIPIYAVTDSTVMVLENGIVALREVKIMNQDAEWILVSHGLNDGDIVVLSKVEAGTRVQSND
ncbi:MAG: hypothetical protein FWE50_02590 [Alphaproteobacteria bacterium]|nr:hypothetical protein [Alphaproteobacteria bacterium]